MFLIKVVAGVEFLGSGGHGDCSTRLFGPWPVIILSGVKGKHVKFEPPFFLKWGDWPYWKSREMDYGKIAEG